MIAHNFEYTAPASLSEAISLLQKHGDQAKLLAGGHSLIPIMKLRLAAPTILIDIGRIPELSYIKEDQGLIRIGALTTHYQIESSDILRRSCTCLYEGAKSIGDVQVRNRGTIGGSVAHADPAADYPASLLAFDATIVALGPTGERPIPVQEFFTDMLTTSLEPNEIVREVRIQSRGGTSGSAYLKMAQKASGFAICGAAANVALDDAGAIAFVALGITGVAARAFRATSTEQALIGKRPHPDLLRDACSRAAEDIIGLDDLNASAEYRLDLATIYSRRALEKALERAHS